MSHFVNQYENMIKKCEDFDMLADKTSFIISKNVFQFVNISIREKMLSLSLSMSFDKFIHELVDATVISNFNEVALNLLIEFCNRICKEYDSITNELSEYVLVVLTICADDKTFIRKLTKERQEELVVSLMKEHLVICDNDLNPDFNTRELILNTCIDSMNKILDGATLENLDKDYSITYDSLESNDMIHVVGELIRPFQSIFMNICYNIDRMRYLISLSIRFHNAKIREYISENAKAIYKNKNIFGISGEVKDTSLIIESLILDLLTIFKMYNDDVIKNNASELITKESGCLIINFIEWIHNVNENVHMTSDSLLKKKFIIQLISITIQAMDSFYSINDAARKNIGFIFTVYRDSEESEDRLLKYEFLEAVKLHVDRDPVYKELTILQADMLEDNAVTNRDRMNDTMSRVYATYSTRYNNPLEQKSNSLLEKTVFSTPTVVATEASNSKSWDYDESENTENDTKKTDNDDKPNVEIVASQKKAKYNKSSKRQSDAQNKIYSAYKKYKNNEEKIDSQLSKMLTSAKSAFSQDATEEIIEGKKFSPIGLLKKILRTGAVFSYSKIYGFIYLVTTHTLSKKRTTKQKQEVLLQIDEEIKLLDEKIEDARGDGNRKAKYSLMRTRGELQRTYDKIKYDLGATKNDLRSSKDYLRNKLSKNN